MRFKASIHNVPTFTKFVASLTSIGNVAWVRLSDGEVRFTIIPEQGSQVWAVLSIDTIFDTYTIQSASPSNTINLEVPLPPLLRALRSATNATSASIRLTKKNGLPALSLTISFAGYAAPPARTGGDNADADFPTSTFDVAPARERQTVVTQDVFVRVLPAEAVDALHEPRCREPDVHVILPPLGQLKAVSDRFIRLASGAGAAGEGRRGVGGGAGPRLVLSATMHGHMRLSLKTDALEITSTWSGLTNPELDPETVEGGEEGVAMHPSTAMRGRRVGGLDEEGGEEVGMGDEDGEGEESAWASVIVDGRDWGKVLGVGRLGGRVVACFVHRHALILYVYIAGDEGPGGEESVLTYYISSYSQ